MRRAAALAGARCRPAAALVLTGGERVRIQTAPSCDADVTRLSARARLVLGIPLDPNVDGAVDLARLPGVGPSLAAAIVRSRPYRSLDEIDRVRGVGPKTLERLRARLQIEVERAPERERPVEREGVERR